MSLTFFKPTQAFLDWAKTTIGNRPVFEAGCGNGSLMKALEGVGINKVVGIDIIEQQVPPYPIGPAIVIGDATKFDYTPGSVVIIARPCHGNFAIDTIHRALQCKCDVIYVGKSELTTHGCKEGSEWYTAKYYESELKPAFDFEDLNVEFDRAPDSDKGIYGEDREVVWVVRNKTLLEQINDFHHTDRVIDRIPPNFGVGIEFDFEGKYYDKEGGSKAVKGRGVTRARDMVGGKRSVAGNVYDYLYSAGAVHYYAKLDVGSLSYDILKPKKKEHLCIDDKYLPPEHKGFSLEVRRPANEDIHSFSMYDGDKVMAKKGKMTHQFKTWNEAFKAMWEEFDRIFGEGWVLTKRFSDEVWKRDERQPGIDCGLCGKEFVPGEAIWNGPGGPYHYGCYKKKRGDDDA